MVVVLATDPHKLGALEHLEVSVAQFWRQESERKGLAQPCASGVPRDAPPGPSPISVPAIPMTTPQPPCGRITPTSASRQ